MIQSAIAILQQAGFDPTAREIAEILWLAVHLDAPENSSSQSPTLPKHKPEKSNESKTLDPETTEESPEVSSEISEPSAGAYLPSSGSSKSTESREAIPIKLPAAIAIRNSLALGRALRPLMRKIPSPVEKILDEEATVYRSSEAKICIPVLQPTPQKWLDVALVIEQSSSIAVWQQTIIELQRLLKHHGAFRDVRTWQLKITTPQPLKTPPQPRPIAGREFDGNNNIEGNIRVELFPQNGTGNYSSTPHKPEALIDPKGQRLILLVSDCISPVWRQQLIQPVLELWGRNGLVTILQLLPERLWERTALSSETPVQLRSLTSGVPNSKLIAETWDEETWEDFTDDEPENQSNNFSKNISKNFISVPIITLEPEALRTWSRVIAGNGNLGTAGFRFSPPVSSPQVQQSESSQKTSLPAAEQPAKLSAKALVSRFRATASPLARRLAGLMAAAPVSLPVVQLIQQTQLKQSQQIHVAEVFMSGLLERRGGEGESGGRGESKVDYIEYEFIDGVRELLLDSVPISKTNSVIDTISEFFARRVGLSVQEFNAYLLNSSQNSGSLEAQIRPFAQIKAQVLRRLGGEYISLAEKLEAQRDLTPLTNKGRGELVSLLDFEFEVLTVNRRGEEIKREKHQAKYFSEDLGNNINLEMVAIHGGKFMMGSPDGEGRDDEHPQHKVSVQPFFMGKYPITQAQWRAVAALPKVERDLIPDPSEFKGDNLPVERVSWYDVIEFCKRISDKTGQLYRLPSEAEWEYACRARTTTPFHFGETITDKLANYRPSKTFADEPKGEYRKKTTDVGIFPPNSFGLYDMHGNVWEWCADDWHKNYEEAPSDGSQWIDANEIDNDSQIKRKTQRGGSWYLIPGNCRSAVRNRNFPDNEYGNVGFRVVSVVAASTLLCQS
jgi:formylglycine-generating enzyme required for sulfatase activity